jgi:poly-gamma-glutamate capsule biosynthesis protein CapA/YwtB (metallophosphatase superfamily)
MLRRTQVAFAAALLYPVAALPQNRPGDGSFVLALGGDAIITRRLSPFTEPAFVRLMDMVRGADAAFVNLEMLFHDYEPAPAHQSGGTYMRAEPALARELVWAGFDLVSLANNHTGDYGVEGMRLTRQHAEAAGLVAAGAGENLHEAREARFLETADGRVALISVASTFPEHSAASRPRDAVRGRPGLNPLRFTTTRTIRREQMPRLRAMFREVGINVPASGDTLRALNTTFVAGDSVRVRTAPNPQDVTEIAAVVRNASRLADYVIVTIHTHEGGESRSEPAEFLVAFARAMIDAGADVFVGHGPHVLRGIELHRGKPIFYSLGDFIFQNETVLRLPQENYATYGLGENQHVADFNAARYSNDTRGFPSDREIWESVVPIVRWRGEVLEAIELHPITLGFGKPATVRGRPMLADRELGQKILNDLITRSRPFATAIETRDGVGHIRIR